MPGRQREGGSDDGLTVLIADGQELYARRLKTALSSEPDIIVVGECYDGDGALRRAAVLHPDVAVVDASLTVADGGSAADSLRAVADDTSVVVLVEDSAQGPGEISRQDLPGIAAAIRAAVTAP